MDIKSMLSDSAGAKAHPPGPPRISTSSHTPHSSYDGRIDYTPSSDVSSARPTPYGHQPSAGGYFPHSQSPYPNASASSTPSVGNHSAWGQSPGGQSAGQGQMSIPPPPHAQSASFVSPQPPTPGSGQHSLAYYNQQYQQLQLQSPPFQPGSLPHALSRQISPAQYQGPPATPLGPPIGYPKPSPHRPSSQGGLDHIRRASVSSISSIISNHNYPTPMEQIRRESTSRSRPSQDFGRERSTSISPKTIPRPAPHREMSTSSQTPSQARPSIDSRPSLPHQSQSHSHMSNPASASFERQVEPIPAQVTPTHSVSSIPEQRQPSTEYAIHSSPAMDRLVKVTSSPAVERVIKREEPQQSLKRSASHLSDAPIKTVKRPRNERPVWAQSARKERSLNLHYVAPAETKGRAAQQQRNTPRPPQQANGAPRQSPVREQIVARPPFACSISDAEMLPDIVYRVTDWVIRTIGNTIPPANAMFELEAKIGHVLADGRRIYLPLIDSETLLNTKGEKGIIFKSEMGEDQHRIMNQRLNDWTRASNEAFQRNPKATRISYEHPRDNDEFFALTDEGRDELDPDLLAFIETPSNLARTVNGRKQIRIRRTKNESGKQYLIKTRIANREIHCPQYEFDYRLSISLEAGWYGNEDHLEPLHDTRGRQKDRMSYTHSAFHVDLTQVRHDDDDHKEHELEVELHSAVLEEELKKFRNKGHDFRLDQYINDMLLNTRVLVRELGPRRQ